jgi:ectoine hydroxylase-related dioxygenase (phytanoyl-CoA dioxygenase family)
MINEILNLKQLSEDSKIRKINEYILLLQNSPKDFYEIYSKLELLESEPIKTPYHFDEPLASKIDLVSQELHAKGIAVWKNFLPNKILADIKIHADSVLDESFEWLKNCNEKYEYHDDEINNCRHVGSKSSFRSGRIRTQFLSTKQSKYNSLLQDLFSDLRINQVGRKAYRSHCFKSYLLFEKLIPSKVEDKWHVDGISDQFKVMLLLEDVGPDNGPLFFKPDSKKFLKTNLKPILFSTFAFGRDWGCYPHPNIINKIDSPTIKMTGKAGDAIFFDTLHIHRGSACIKNSRTTLVYAMGVESYKNQVLRLLKVE